MSSFISDFLKIGFSKVLVIIFSLATSILTARTLGPEKNGIITALLVYPSLFITFGSLGVSQSITYFIGKDIYSEERIKTALTQIWLFTSFISIIICLFLIYTLVNSSQVKFHVILLAALPIPFTLFNSYNTGLFLGKNEISKYNRINWIPTFLIFILSLFFILVLKWDIEGVMIASVGGALIMTIILLIKNNFLKHFKFSLEVQVIKSLLSLGVIYAVSLLIINLNYKIDVILINSLSTPFELGIYSKGAALTQYLWQIPMLFSTLVFAKSATSKNDNSFSLKVAQLLRISLVSIGLVCLILILISDFLIILMFGKEYSGSTIVLQYLLPGVLLLTIFKVMNMDLAGQGKPWISLKAMIPSLVVNIIFNLILIPIYGAKGAAIASTLSYSLAAFLFIHFYSKETGIPAKEIFKFRKNDFDPLIKILRKLVSK